MERTPVPEKKEQSDPRLQRALRVVRNVLLAAGVTAFYGGTFAYEINRGLEKRHEREEQSARIDKEIAKGEEQRQQSKEWEGESQKRGERIREGKLDEVRAKEGTISGEDWRKFMERGYPVGWFDQVSIRQNKGLFPMSGYNLPGFAGATASGHAEGTEIGFYENSDQMDMRQVVEIFSHESCHATEQRMARLDQLSHQQLRADLDRRVASEDRFRSGYVESIANENEADRNFNKATEYWAEICEEYFHAPDQLHVKDFQLVEAVVKRQDPNFNLRDARLERGILLGRLRAEAEPIG